MTCGQPSEGGEEYPQAIADDYPGWVIEHEDSQWIAWCPAVTVAAATAAGLRTALERAIGGEPDSSTATR